ILPAAKRAAGIRAMRSVVSKSLTLMVCLLECDVYPDKGQSPYFAKPDWPVEYLLERDVRNGNAKARNNLQRAS
ncbi:MAG: hypothetical protein M1469_00800, partial [Bacteroidetes bacterium]|nr:hypothetical protein [Bacteroidota bacterium]